MRDRRKSTMYVGPGNLWKQLWSRLSSTAPALAFACTAFLWGNSFDLAVWLADPTQLQASEPRVSDGFRQPVQGAIAPLPGKSLCSGAINSDRTGRATWAGVSFCSVVRFR
jgi:hypothetical protein